MRDNVAADKADTPRRYYAVVESDHPYKPAAVHNYRVIVPQNSVTYLLTYLLT